MKQFLNLPQKLSAKWQWNGLLLSMFLSFLFTSFSTAVQSQSCTGNFTIEASRTYDPVTNKTTFTYKITKTGAQNGLSHFSMPLQCDPPTPGLDISQILIGAVAQKSNDGTNWTSATSTYGTDPSTQSCYTGPVFKFDEAASGNIVWFRLIVNGNWQLSPAFGIVKYGSTCCVIDVQGGKCLTESCVPLNPGTLSGNTVCAPATGTISLSSAPSGAKYQLKKASDNSNVDAAKDGNDGVLNWTGLAAGTYYVSVYRVPADDCSTVTNEATVTINAAPGAPTLGKTDPTCTVATGCVTVTSSTAGLTFSIDGGAFAAYPAGGWCGLAAGSTHKVRAQNASGCISPEAEITLAAQPPTPMAPTLGKTDPTCTVATGCVTVTSSTAGLTFSIDGGAFAAYPAGGWCGLAAGSTHKVRAQNASGCISPEAEITLAAQPPTPMAPTLGKTDPTCTVATGCVTVTSSTAGLTFSIDGGAFAAYPAGGWCGLAAGSTHKVRAQNASGCISPEAEITLAAQPPTPMAPTLGKTDPTCTVATGCVTVTSSTAGLTFSIDGGAFAAYPAGGWCGLAAGSTHKVRAQNASGCISPEAEITLAAQPPTPGAPTAGPNSRCGTGTVSLTASGCAGTLKWYAASSGGDPIGTGSPFVTPSISQTTSYWVSCTSAQGCEGPRTEVVATVNPIPTVTADDAKVCIDATVQLTGLPAGGSWSGAHVDANGLFNAAGLAAGSYVVTYTYTDANRCSNSDEATVVVENCNELYCSYTQGYFGNEGGTACTPNGTSTTLQLISNSIGNMPGDQLYLGKPGRSLTIPQADASKIFDLLPNGGPSVILSGNNTWNTLPKKGNTLLAQTITLALNVYIPGSELGSFSLADGAGKWMITRDNGGTCADPVPADCKFDPIYTEGIITGYTLVYNPYQGWKLPANVINALGGAKTVMDLLKLASDALGGAALPAGVTLGAIADAAAAINEGFDECRYFVKFADTNEELCVAPDLPITLAIIAPSEANSGRRPSGTEPVQVSKLTITTYPNPFVDQLNFRFVSPVSGRATLEVINMYGQRLGIVFDGQVKAGVQNFVNYRNAPALSGMLLYKLTVGDETVVGKVQSIK
jgi:hypothetical protein